VLTADPSSPPKPRQSVHRHARRARRTVLFAVLLPLGLLIPDSSFAQSFGRWWWTARAGARQTISTVKSTGSASSENRNTDFRLAGAVNGFVVHPALGDFGVDLDLLFRKNRGSRELDTDRLGFGVRLSMLPKSGTPFRLFAQRRNYDYSGLNTGEPLSSYRLPTTTTRWGGSTNLRRGALRGVKVAFDQLSFDHEDGTDLGNSRQTVDWTRSFGRIQNRLSLKRITRDLGAVGSGFKDFTLGLVERGPLSSSWYWSFSGTALRREIRSADQSMVGFDDLRLITSFSHEMGRDDLLVISARAGRLRRGALLNSDDYRTSVSYRWRPKPVWSITPFLDYSSVSQDSYTLSSPRMNVTVAWNPRVRRWDALLSGTGTYGLVQIENEVETNDRTEAGFDLIGSVARGSRGGLRTSFEAEISRNQLRLSTDPILDLPDLGLSRNRLGAQDYARARFGLDRSKGSHSISGWIDWTRRQSSGDLDLSNFRTDAYTAVLGYNARRFDLRSSLGQTETSSEARDPQTLRYAGLQARWRALRFLDLRASYRKDLRMVVFAPNLDGEQFGGGLTLRLGLVDVDVAVLAFNNQLDELNDVSRRSIVWSVSRRFAGWLPIVTGTQRAGVIR